MKVDFNFELYFNRCFFNLKQIVYIIIMNKVNLMKAEGLRIIGWPTKTSYPFGLFNKVLFRLLNKMVRIFNKMVQIFNKMGQIGRIKSIPAECLLAAAPA